MDEPLESKIAFLRYNYDEKITSFRYRCFNAGSASTGPICAWRLHTQPVHNIAVRMRGDGIDLSCLLSGDVDSDGTGYAVSPLDGVNGVRRNPLARIGTS